MRERGRSGERKVINATFDPSADMTFNVKLLVMMWLTYQLLRRSSRLKTVIVAAGVRFLKYYYFVVRNEVFCHSRYDSKV